MLKGSVSAGLSHKNSNSIAHDLKIKNILFIKLSFALILYCSCSNTPIEGYSNSEKSLRKEDSGRYNEKIKTSKNNEFQSYKDIMPHKKLNEGNKLIFLLAGDAMLGRSFNEKFNKQNLDFVDNEIQKHIDNSEGVICNLETTITSSNQINKTRVFNFKLNPEYKNALRQNKIKYVSLANNHIFDYGIEGMKDTIQNLDSIFIKHAGAGDNLNEASRPAILELNGMKIGFLSLADHFEDSKSEVNKPGIWYIDIKSYPTEEIQKIKNKIIQLKTKVDFLIVSLHWNYNYVKKIEKPFIDFAHQLIDAGADIIHGHSPHHILPIERYKDKLIFYSLGSYIDDYAINEFRNDLSVMIKLELEKNKRLQYNVIPIKIKDMQTITSLSKKEQEFINQNLYAENVEKFSFITENVQ